MMSHKIFAAAAVACGLYSIKQVPRSIKPRSVEPVGRNVAKQVDNLDSHSILANYNRAFVESNLK